MNVQVRTDATPVVSGFLGCGEDRVVLKLLRQETPTLVVLVMAENEKRKEQWKAENEKHKEQWRRDEDIEIF